MGSQCADTGSLPLPRARHPCKHLGGFRQLEQRKLKPAHTLGQREGGAGSGTLLLGSRKEGTVRLEAASRPLTGVHVLVPQNCDSAQWGGDLRRLTECGC